MVIKMKARASLYWIKVGLLIGLGFILVQIFAPLAATLILLAIVCIPIIILFGTIGRSIDSLIGYYKLRKGWADRAKR